MTSNIGSNIIQDNFTLLNDTNHDEVVARTKNELFELLRKTIRPEFLNRIDEIIMFQPLSRNEIGAIVKLQFNQLQETLSEMGIHIEATDAALEWLGQLGYDPQFGARPLKRVIQKRVLNELSKQILAGKINKDSRIRLDEFDHNFVFLNA